ncbi:MAG TPA: MBL fold metallo-hydrolase [Phototrophicaceae bacterium]|jgi:glyoxylase-like metal-dependent hydrolase (beta-lactamase superfamily II)|nr:MBL fold metallo-hydrolase [Phototrophicaceae bacterium]
MKITKHGNHLIQLTRLGFINCFLVHESDGFTLIDTGMSGTANAIIKAAQELGAPIRRITLTHAHVDHVGSLDALHQLLPDAEISISARDARFLRGDMSLDPNEPQTKLRGGYTPCTTVPNRELNPGDKVGSLEVVASPGHTPGHIAFFDLRDKTLIAGDAYSTTAKISTAGTFLWRFPLTAMATWNKPTGLRSAEALYALKPERLAVGHGRTLEQPMTAMKQAIDEAARRIEGS